MDAPAAAATFDPPAVTRWPRRTLLAAGLVAAVLAVTAAVGAARVDAPSPVVSVPLAHVPQGVSGVRVDGHGIYLSRHGSTVLALATTMPTRVAHELRWCRDYGIFVEGTYATLFDAAGRRIDGPAARGIDRYDVHVHDGKVFVDTRNLRPGPPLREQGELPLRPVNGVVSDCWYQAPPAP